MLKTVKNGSGIQVDPCFFKIPTFSRFFSLGTSLPFLCFKRLSYNIMFWTASFENGFCRRWDTSRARCTRAGRGESASESASIKFLINFKTIGFELMRILGFMSCLCVPVEVKCRRNIKTDQSQPSLSCTSINSAFEELRRHVPTFPYEKRLSKVRRECSY